VSIANEMHNLISAREIRSLSCDISKLLSRDSLISHASPAAAIFEISWRSLARDRAAFVKDTRGVPPNYDERVRERDADTQ